jgi:hypothetical protein
MKTGLTLWLVLLAPGVLAQTPEKRQFDLVFPATMLERPQLDTAVNVRRLSLIGCNRLIETMFAIDQQYRDSLRHNPGEASQRRFSRLMLLNDAAHQTILLKILAYRGWPCWKRERELSFKAWIIAWHARSDLDRMRQFYKYIAAASQRKCIAPGHFADFRNQIGLLQNGRSR